MHMPWPTRVWVASLHRCGWDKHTNAWGMGDRWRTQMGAQIAENTEGEGGEVLRTRRNEQVLAQIVGMWRGGT